MTDEQLLFIVLLSLYFSECIVWVRNNSIIFTSLIGRGWVQKYPNDLFGNLKGGLWINNPFPPLGYTFICNMSPVSISPTHITTFLTNNLNNIVEPVKPIQSIAFNEIKTIEVQSRKITINSNFNIKANTHQYAKLLYEFILINKDLNKQEREQNIKNLMIESLNVDKIRELWHEYTSKSIYLRILCNTIWIHVFIISPLMIISSGFIESIFNLFLSYLFWHIITIITFYFTFKHFCVATNKDELYINLFKMVLYPPAVIRSIDSISINIFEGYHPLAVIFILDPPKQFYLFSQKLILDLKYPLKQHIPSKEIQKITQWYRMQQLNIYNSFLKDKGVDLEQLLLPTNSIEGFKSFCPRCLTKYLIDEGKCSECPEIKLINLEEKND